MALHISVKHIQINKAETKILATVAIAVVVAIFGLFGIKSMISKGAYQQRVLNEKHKVINQLKANYTAAQSLVSQYKIFAGQTPNVIGGLPGGTGNRDGDNGQIVLDALPSTYDAPALASSIEKLLAAEHVTIHSINVKDDPTTHPDQPQAQPTPVIINFDFTSESTFQTNQQVLKDFERSIRPFDVSTMSLSGSDSTLTMSINMNTYYQPARSLDTSNTKEIR